MSEPEPEPEFEDEPDQQPPVLASPSSENLVLTPGRKPQLEPLASTPAMGDNAAPADGAAAVPALDMAAVPAPEQGAGEPLASARSDGDPDEGAPPSIELAAKRRAANMAEPPAKMKCCERMARCLKCSCCKLDKRFKDDVAQYGVGTSMYFTDIKRLGIVFGIMSCIAMPAILTHMFIKGESTSLPGLPGLLSYTFLGNVPPPDHEVWEMPFFASGTLMSPKDLFFFYNFLDAVYAITFIVFIGWLARTQIDELAELDDKAVTCGDYAVRVTGLPSVGAAGAEEVIQATKAFFEQLLGTQFDLAMKGEKGAILDKETPRGQHPPEVVEVTLSLNQRRLLLALKKRASAALKYQKALNKSAKSTAKFQRSQTKQV